MDAPEPNACSCGRRQPRSRAACGPPGAPCFIPPQFAPLGTPPVDSITSSRKQTDPQARRPPERQPMSLPCRLLRLALGCQRSWIPPQTCGSTLRPSVASGALPPPPPPAACPSGGARCLASSSSSGGSSRRGRGSGATPQQRQGTRPRRAVAAGAGRRGNIFLDDSAAGRRRGGGAADDEYSAAVRAWLAGGSMWPWPCVLAGPGCAACGLQDRGPLPRPSHHARRPRRPQKLFDSSRFNYDSDDEEEGVSDQQADQQQQAEQQQAVPAAAGAQQQGTAASAAGAAAEQQRRRRAAQGEDGGEQQGDAAAEVVLPPPRGTKVKTAEFVKSSVSVEQCPPAVYPEFAGGRGLAVPAFWMRWCRQARGSGRPRLLGAWPERCIGGCAMPPRHRAGGRRCQLFPLPITARLRRASPPAPRPAVIGRSNVGKSSLINLLTGRSSLAMVSKTPGGWLAGRLGGWAWPGKQAVPPPPLTPGLARQPACCPAAFRHGPQARPGASTTSSSPALLHPPIAGKTRCINRFLISHPPAPSPAPPRTQARRGASTTSSSTAPGTWWTCPATGGGLGRRGGGDGARGHAVLELRPSRGEVQGWVLADPPGCG